MLVVVCRQKKDESKHAMIVYMHDVWIEQQPPLKTHGILGDKRQVRIQYHRSHASPKRQGLNREMRLRARRSHLLRKFKFYNKQERQVGKCGSDKEALEKIMRARRKRALNEKWIPMRRGRGRTGYCSRVAPPVPAAAFSMNTKFERCLVYTRPLS